VLADPAARPTIAETHGTLMGIRTPTTTTAVLAGPPAPAAPTRLKGRGLRTAAGRASAPAPERGPTRRLVGKLLERRRDAGAP
jgi:hypothetical protein